MIVEREAMLALLHKGGTDEAGFVIKAASGGVDGEIMSISGAVCVVAFRSSARSLCFSCIDYHQSKCDLAQQHRMTCTLRCTGVFIHSTF